MSILEMEVARSTVRANKAIASHYERIDWEQRRYEIAKAAMQSLLGFIGYKPDPKQMAEYSVVYADALIEKLKEEG